MQLAIVKHDDGSDLTSAGLGVHFGLRMTGPFVPSAFLAPATILRIKSTLDPNADSSAKNSNSHGPTLVSVRGNPLTSPDRHIPGRAEYRFPFSRWTLYVEMSGRFDSFAIMAVPRSLAWDSSPPGQS